MSTFKNNLDAIFTKIFPAASAAAEEDHGGFNIGDLSVILLDLVLLIYTCYRSWHFLSSSVTNEFQILAIVGLWGLDIGAVIWSVVWIFGSTTKFQNWVSMSLFVVDLIGVFITSIVDTVMYSSKDALPPIMQSIAWFGIPIIIGLNVLAGFVYHMTSPSTRKRRAERVQDEDMAKQQEKGDLELRRMTMQLKQAQDYTTKRATMLVSFAEIAEQNIAMTEIESQMMAKLNKAASGQLGNLMNATGLSMPGAAAPQPTDTKPGIADKLNELKKKFGTTEGEAETPRTDQAPIQPSPTPAGSGNNGTGVNPPTQTTLPGAIIPMPIAMTCMECGKQSGNEMFCSPACEVKFNERVIERSKNRIDYLNTPNELVTSLTPPADAVVKGNGHGQDPH